MIAGLGKGLTILSWVVQSKCVAGERLLSHIFKVGGHMECPYCETEELEAMIEYSGVQLDRCTTCEGLWFDGGELEQVLDSPVQGLELPEDAEKGEKICPRCRVEMFVFQYPTTQVIVDMCPDCHGLWLDGGELVEIAASRNTQATTPGPRYRYRSDAVYSYIVEKVQQTEHGKEERQYYIDNLQLSSRHENYLEVDKSQIALTRNNKTHQVLRIDDKGRFYDHTGLHGFVGAAGVKDNLVSVSHVYDVYYFPWLPNHSLSSNYRWDVGFCAGSSPELQEQSIIEIEAHFSVIDITRNRGRKCAEMRFTYEGERHGSKRSLTLDGRGTWIFDLERNVDILLEKHTNSTGSVRSSQGGTTRHTVRRVLSEQPLGYLSESG